MRVAEAELQTEWNILRILLYVCEYFTRFKYACMALNLYSKNLVDWRRRKKNIFFWMCSNSQVSMAHLANRTIFFQMQSKYLTCNWNATWLYLIFMNTIRRIIQMKWGHSEAPWKTPNYSCLKFSLTFCIWVFVKRRCKWNFEHNSIEIIKLWPNSMDWNHKKKILRMALLCLNREYFRRISSSRLYQEQQ